MLSHNRDRSHNLVFMGQMCWSLDVKSGLLAKWFISYIDYKFYNSDEIATAFNEFFINIVTNYLPPRNEEHVANREKLKSFIKSKGTPGVSSDIPHISHDFVLKQLKELDPTKAIGMDEVA